MENEDRENMHQPENYSEGRKDEGQEGKYTLNITTQTIGRKELIQIKST